MSLFSLNIIICFIILLIVNYSLSKAKLLIDKPELGTHKYIHDSIIPLSGGIFFLSSAILLSIINQNNYILFLYLFPFLVIGIFADTKKNFSPILRLILQLFFIFLIVNSNEIIISSIDFYFFDYLLKNNLFNVFFVCFCLITVLNGHNLMDGLNGFVLGNFILIFAAIYLINILHGISLENLLYQNIPLILIILSTFFIFNFFGKCFLGDNGTYIFSIFTSVIVINFVEQSNSDISPLLAATFLWYPAFENLFSILRRLKRRESIAKPDQLHLHLLIKSYLNLKFKSNLSHKLINSLSGLLINVFLLPNFVLSIFWYNNSINLMILILTQIIIYTLIYLKLIDLKNSKQ